jgi:hypothetical protein
VSQMPPSPVRSTAVNRVSEMTLVNNICQGFTAPLVVTKNSSGQIVGIGPDPTAAPVRYVDNLRTALAIVGEFVGAGVVTVLDEIATIHFARWVVLPGNLQVLFTSNFDGSWEQYIHDFITIGNSGVPTAHNQLGTRWFDLIWGNCVDYPGTDDFPAFLGWIQANMVETTLFFPEISDVTVRDVAWFREFWAHFATFDEAALAVERQSWPPALLAAYDQFKNAVNQIDVEIL